MYKNLLPCTLSNLHALQVYLLKKISVQVMKKTGLKLVIVLVLALLAKATDHHVYIVYMGAEKYDNPTTTKESHHRLLARFLGSREAARRSILYSYKHGFSGFAARLTRWQAEEMADLPEVVQVTRSLTHKLLTTRSWDFIGFQPNQVKKLSTRTHKQNGAIIGVIDSGVWPESKSFLDEGIGPAPSHWKGICQPGQRFNLSNCNNKLIGARWFAKGIKPYLETTEPQEFLSPRDAFGHGTHTASTACGNFVVNANYKGLARGLARGGAPYAHLSVYKACWLVDDDGMCSDADVLKAFDKAIFDGVDVLSISLGLDVPIFSYVDRRDSIMIGSFHAVARGITVVASAGNDGPSMQTVVNVAPWLITVAASTIDRTFLAAISLGNNRTFWGLSIDTRKSYRGFVGLTYSQRVAIDTDDGSAKSCESGTLNSTLTAGKIVLCFDTSDYNDGSEIFSASKSVRKAGGVGVIFAQSRDDGLRFCDAIPCVKVDFEAGTHILSYIRRAKSPVAKLSSASSVIGKLASPRIASFSSRGPSSISPQVLKPDVAAPGVDILAAYLPSGEEMSGEYALMSGTSMSCPHVAGIAAVIKSVHPMWSPAAVRSALVTTALQTATDGTHIRDGGSTNKPADAFDMGGGHVNPINALDPGLIYDININDYVKFLCSINFNSRSIASLTNKTIQCKKDTRTTSSLDLNLPSIVIPRLTHKATVSRTVRNVGPIVSVYEVIVESPETVEIKVEPRVLRFNSSVQVLRFEVTFLTSQKLHGDYGFGSLTWTDGQHFVRSPIAVRVRVWGTSSVL